MDETVMHPQRTTALLTHSAAPLSPQNPKAIAVLLKPLIDLHGEPRNWATAAPLYLDALKDIPPELLAVAVRDQVLRNPYFPKPAELRAAITDELADYRRRRDEARRPRLPAPEPIPEPTAEDKAYVDARLAPVLASLREKTAALKGTKAERDYGPDEMAQARAELGIA